MATRAKKIPELPSANTLSGSDLFIVEKVGANSSTTSKMSANDVKKQMALGPFANSSVAANSGVLVGQMYYSEDGIVRVRLS